MLRFHDMTSGNGFVYYRRCRRRAFFAQFFLQNRSITDSVGWGIVVVMQVPVYAGST